MAVNINLCIVVVHIICEDLSKQNKWHLGRLKTVYFTPLTIRGREFPKSFISEIQGD